jgi:hypothetical protein
VSFHGQADEASISPDLLRRHGLKAPSRRGGHAIGKVVPDSRLAKELHIRALRRLPDMGERVIRGAVWTKFSDSREFKVSPHGLQGDYDRDAYWVPYEDLKYAL